MTTRNFIDDFAMQRINENSTKATESSWEVTVAKSIDAVEGIRPIWEKMHSGESYPIINSDIDRYLSVIEACGNNVRPYVMLLKENDQPVAMLIGRLEQNQIKSRLGYKTLLTPKLRCLTVVYGGIIGQPRPDAYVLLVYELMKILSRRESDVVYFNHLRTDSVVYQLAREMPGFWCRSRFPKIEPHWKMSVPDNIDLFYVRCSKSHRKHLRRYQRRLQNDYEDRVKISTYSQMNEIERVIEDASEISRKTYQYALGYGFAKDGKRQVQLQTAARNGWLRAHILYVANEPIAYRIVLKYGRTCFLSGTGYDPKWRKYNPGTILFLNVLEKLCADHAVESIDFGFGDAEFKRSYGDHHWQEASIYIFAPRLYPIVVNVLRTSIVAVNSALKHIFRKAGFAAIIKRKWRNALQAGNKHRRE
ncbi:MAG: GNAT family N-acetyltransferase [Sedimentisphaerales bacterium]|nr:GNAT family N-acetyltransferase [Sedimentisphaerales bacterium]